MEDDDEMEEDKEDEGLRGVNGIWKNKSRDL